MSTFEGKRIVVTGGTGMVGSHLTAELLREGCSPVLLVRDPQHTTLLRRTLERMGVADRYDRITFRTSMLNNPHELAEAFTGVDTVFHCAAQVSFDSDEANSTIAVNTEITNHIVNAALECKVGLLVYFSSIATLGAPRPGEELITEQSTLSSLVDRSAYSTSKFFAENAVLRGMSEGLRAIILNPGIILGEGNWQKGSAQLIALGLRPNPFYTHGTKGYVDVRDVVRLAIRLAECPEAVGERFILCSANLTFKEFFTMVRRTVNGWAPHIGLSRRTLFMLMHMERQLSRHFTHHKCLLTTDLINNACDRSLYSSSKVTRLLHTQFTPIDDTIARVASACIDETHHSKQSNR